MKKLFLLLLTVGMCALGQSATAQRLAVSAAEVNGTFRDRRKSEFKVLALGGGKLKIQFDGLHEFRTADGKPMANGGQATGVAAVKGDRAVFRPGEFDGECIIKLYFRKPGELVVEQVSYCGFGVGVVADGVYHKVSSQKPRFDD